MFNVMKYDKQLDQDVLDYPDKDFLQKAYHQMFPTKDGYEPLTVEEANRYHKEYNILYKLLRHVYNKRNQIYSVQCKKKINCDDCLVI